MASKTTTRTSTSNDTFTADEREAMKERARELKRAKAGADGLADLQAKIAEMPDSDRVMAERIHAIVGEVAPHLTPRTFYGMPAWAKDGKVVIYFQSAAKFKARYATFGVNEDAQLDEGSMWPTSWALTQLTPSDEERIRELVRRSVG